MQSNIVCKHFDIIWNFCPIYQLNLAVLFAFSKPRSECPTLYVVGFFYSVIIYYERWLFVFSIVEELLTTLFKLSFHNWLYNAFKLFASFPMFQMPLDCLFLVGPSSFSNVSLNSLTRKKFECIHYIGF